MVVILVVIDLIIVAMVVGGSRDHNLTVHRMETTEAMYAAEAGVNMAVREMMYRLDEDGDAGVWPTGIGTISHDLDDGNDPTLGNARFVVTAAADTPAAGQTTFSSTGRCGEARRKAEAVLE
jgi:hypothetical protein